MRRRDFLGTVAAATACSAGQIGCPEASAGERQDVNRNVDRDGRRFSSSRQFLFTDLRHIDAGDLIWRSPDGRAVPVAGPPEPPVQVQPDASRVARGIRLIAQRANKEGPINGLPSGVVSDDGLYRAWSIRTRYAAGQDLGSYSVAPARSITIEYSESKDGYAWPRRDLNEIPLAELTGIDGAGFFVDPHGPAEERYKGLYNARVLSGVSALWERYHKVHPRNRHVSLGPDYIYCLFGLVSPDGLHWKPLAEPLLIHKGDTDNTVYYDEWLQRYVLYTRYMRYDRRTIARAESDDFRRWSPVEPVVASNLQDPCSYDVYTNARTDYPGLPEHHFMFPMIYRRDTQTSEIHIYTSTDGVLWDRVPGGPVLEPSEPSGWDGKFLVATKNLVPLGKDRVGIPYSGVSHPHKYPRWKGVISAKSGWAWWPQGRLVALRADTEGQFQTFPIPVTGRRLRLNAKVRSGGELRVGIHGAGARSAVDCDPITGDRPAHPVSWRGDGNPGVSPGATVRLHFQLRAAELFGFEWA
jgi:hypothetical protein